MATINLSSHSVPEDAQAFRPVGILNVEGGAEGETFTFTLADERFEIAEGDGGQYVIVVKEGASFDFETGARQYTIEVQATGSLNTPVDPASFQIDVTDVNEAPTDIVVTGGSVGDNADLGTVVASLQGQDPDEGDEFSYTFVTDATGTTARDHDLFEIVDNQILVKGQLAVGTHSLWVKVTDSGNPALFYVKPITLTITDANEAPEVTWDFVDVVEGAGGGTPVGTLSAVDPEGNEVSYSLSEASDEIFDLVDNRDGTWSVVVDPRVRLSLKEAAHQSFTVTVSDGFNTFEETHDINLVENQAPEVTFDPADLAKTAPAGTVVGVLSAMDNEDDAVDYTLLGESAKLFEITVVEGNVVVRSLVEISFSNPAHRSFTMQVSDGVNAFEESFNLSFSNEAPQIELLPVAVIENVQGAKVGELSATDPEGDALTYKLVGDNAHLFVLVKSGDGYDILLRPGVALDFENNQHHTLSVEVSDGVNAVQESMPLDLDDVDEAPVLTFAARTVSEGVKGGTIVGRLSATDPEGDEVSGYKLSSLSAKYFMLMEKSDGGYDVVIRSGVTLDYENPDHLSFHVTVSDGENEVSRTLALNLLDTVDMVTGTQRKDTLKGQSGADLIKGLGGDDTLIGNGGNDMLYGGLGKDVLTGGSGQDVFVFDTKPSGKANSDRLTDFDVKDDSIWLENKVFTKLGKAGSAAMPAQLSKSSFAIDRAKDKNDYLIYNEKTGVLSYDADGSGSKSAIEIAQLKKGLGLSHKDFFVI
jgi:hypothetical protein